MFRFWYHSATLWLSVVVIMLESLQKEGCKGMGTTIRLFRVLKRCGSNQYHSEKPFSYASRMNILSTHPWTCLVSKHCEWQVLHLVRGRPIYCIISSALQPFHEVSSAICSGEKRVESGTIRGQRERPETLLIRWSHTKYATAARFIVDNEIIHGREREW